MNTSRIVLVAVLSLFLCAGIAAGVQVAEADLFELSIEELMNIEIVSASKKEQNLSKTPSAVFVITQEDIRRSGATQLPELLRMVPGLTVGRINAGAWAVTSRGFLDRFSNKLLVLIDGRAIYTPIFSGVYWSMHEPLLEDIERIEVIRGPGGSMWGANAVNGIINIITKHSQDTQGGMMTATVGTHERALGGFRYGEALDDDTFYRVWAKYVDMDENQTTDGEPAGDFRRALTAGWRFDTSPEEEFSFSFHGGFVRNIEDEPTSMSMGDAPSSETPVREVESWSGYLLGQAKYRFSQDSILTVTSYVDANRAQETQPMMYPAVEADYDFDAFDLEVRHNYRFAENHDLIYGAGIRLYSDRYEYSVPEYWNIDPSADDRLIANFFVQDEIDLYDNLQLTLGSKLEYNEYTEWEIQPTARLFWQPLEDYGFWAAVSRAVRTPSRHEHDAERLLVDSYDGAEFGVDKDVLLYLVGNDEAEAENVLSYELGSRARPHKDVFLDVTAFVSVYDDLLTYTRAEPYPSGDAYAMPTRIDNTMDGQTYGIELACSIDLQSWWRVKAAYTYLHAEMEPEDSIDADFSEKEVEGQIPHNTIHLRSHMDFTEDLALDLTLRYIDEMKLYDVPSYWEADFRLGWYPYEDLELSLVGRNLIQDGHQEAFDGFMTMYPVEIERSLYLKATLYF